MLFDREFDGVGGGVLVMVSVFDFVGDFVRLIGVIVIVLVKMSECEIEIDSLSEIVRGSDFVSCFVKVSVAT